MFWPHARDWSAVVQLSTTGSPGEVQGQQGHVAGRRYRQQHADLRRLDFASRLEKVAATSRSLAAQDAHPIVRDHDVLPVGQGMFDEGGRDRVAQEDLQRPDLGGPTTSRRRRQAASAGTPLGEGEELAEVYAALHPGETELALDLQAQFRRSRLSRPS